MKILNVSLIVAIRLNFGSFLQAFALQNIFPESIQLNTTDNYMDYINQKLRKIPFLNLILAYIRGRKRVNKYIHPEYQMLRLTEEAVHRNNELKHFGNFDAYLLTSDQVWHDGSAKGRENLYFLNVKNNRAKRIAYAASLGKKEWPKAFEKKAIPYLKNMTAISVREESAKKYLESIGIKNVACVCDPVVLLDGNFYKDAFKIQTKNTQEVFFYKLREEMPCVMTNIFENKLFTYDMENRTAQMSVTDWLTHIANAEFVVTDSFHGTVICILFHKPFAVLLNRGARSGMNDRFYTILEKTNLSYRILSANPSEEEIKQLVAKEIDWSNVDSILEKWRAYSLDWLHNAVYG